MLSPVTVLGSNDYLLCHHLSHDNTGHRAAHSGFHAGQVAELAEHPGARILIWIAVSQPFSILIFRSDRRRRRVGVREPGTRRWAGAVPTVPPRYRGCAPADPAGAIRAGSGSPRSRDRCRRGNQNVDVAPVVVPVEGVILVHRKHLARGRLGVHHRVMQLPGPEELDETGYQLRVGHRRQPYLGVEVQLVHRLQVRVLLRFLVHVDLAPGTSARPGPMGCDPILWIGA